MLNGYSAISVDAEDTGVYSSKYSQGQVKRTLSLLVVGAVGVYAIGSYFGAEPVIAPVSASYSVPVAVDFEEASHKTHEGKHEDAKGRKDDSSSGFDWHQYADKYTGGAGDKSKKDGKDTGGYDWQRYAGGGNGPKTSGGGSSSSSGGGGFDWQQYVGGGNGLKTSSESSSDWQQYAAPYMGGYVQGGSTGEGATIEGEAADDSGFHAPVAAGHKTQKTADGNHNESGFNWRKYLVEAKDGHDELDVSALVKDVTGGQVDLDDIAKQGQEVINDRPWDKLLGDSKDLFDEKFSEFQDLLDSKKGDAKHFADDVKELLDEKSDEAKKVIDHWKKYLHPKIPKDQVEEKEDAKKAHHGVQEDKHHKPSF